MNATTSRTFSPASVDIARTGTVNWIFAGLAHTVTFGGSNAPANISATSNMTVSRVFNVAGTFAYQCTIHPEMTAQVIVH